MGQISPKNVWLPPSAGKIALFTILLLICQATDAVCTACAVISHQAYELNPLMAWLLNRGYWHFLIVKFAMAAVGCGVLAWASARWHWVWVATRLLTLLFLLLVGFHAICYGLYCSP